MDLEVDEFDAPIGTLTLVACGPAIVALGFEPPGPRLRARLGARFGEIELRAASDPRGVSTRMRAYFSGDLDALSAIHIEAGGTPFQRRVWEAVRAIPPAATRSYGALAASLGKPSGARAVGLANGQNPIALIVPCHRVIGSTGALTGYAWGLDRKRWLLAHEAAHASPPWGREPARAGATSSTTSTAA